MESKKIRQHFLDYFQAQNHKIVASAPIVVKNDPTLMFTNAGMNQFKDYFLGNAESKYPRIADTQKCLRVSGKHNDLEEVGTDGYHHTMFEMLGNWSFGDYFKKEAIDMAWDLLTNVYNLPKDRLYVSVFGGDPAENLAEDTEAVNYWKKWVPEDRILRYGKKDNFWEMGDTGPCGPCSEIHIDLRTDEQRNLHPGAVLVNAGSPEVMEIWNLVFIQYNRKADGSLEELPQKHVDTGMGFERLSMVLQNKTSSYDTDIFSGIIQFISAHTGIKYTGSYEASAKSDMAMRVMADHLRAVCFAIADGSIPSNTGQGYVIRRILRRAVRYGYSFLNIREPFLFKLIPILRDQMAAVFPELIAQNELMVNVMHEEEQAFLRTLEGGLRRLESLDPKTKAISGQLAFELYDTYGFPFDLTQLIARENKWMVDEDGFKAAMQEQKDRSRSDAKKEYSDWNILKEGETKFVGYDTIETTGASLLRWRKIQSKGNEYFQLVFDQTPFYPEGGGQVGDTGLAFFAGTPVEITDTVKENDLILHLTDRLPATLDGTVELRVNGYRRQLIENNHSATHLLHAALRSVLGPHVQQRGSLVREDYLRFDFSHFQKVEEEQLIQIEKLVNEKIRLNLAKDEQRNLPIGEAQKSGAMMLFGEKYGEQVRMITFDPAYSVELCGGCHVESTGQIGYFKITGESAVAAGIRRIEAISSIYAEQLIQEQFRQLKEIKQLLKTPGDPLDSIVQLTEEVRSLNKQIQDLKAAKAGNIKEELLKKAEPQGDIQLLVSVIDINDSKIAKNLIHQIGSELSPAIVLFGFEENEKAQLMCYISEELCSAHNFNAATWLREIARSIEGGGGGQPFFATAGGKKPSGLAEAIEKAKVLITNQIKSAVS